MDIGGGPAVPSELDVGVPLKVIFGVNHRGLAPDQDDGKPVVQHTHFIGGQELTATLSSGEFKETPHNFKIVRCFPKSGLSTAQGWEKRWKKVIIQWINFKIYKLFSNTYKLFIFFADSKYKALKWAWPFLAEAASNN